ncbi:MAG: TatD family hydrolase [Elusimicrobiales bacterium]|nr:TatD family hydrolase [Elusimicrobiales bacterium]
MKYFDAHDHLQDFPSEDGLGAALRAAAEAGVEGMLCCGTCPEDWGRVLELAGRDARVKPCFGLHPWLTAEEGWLQKLEEFVRRVPCCVGEIGLDGVKGLPGHEENFAAQLELAARFGRPAVLHCVKSWGRLLELLKAARPDRFMLHAYGGSPELVKDLAALGGYFSFGAEIQDPARARLRAALAAVPQDRLLLETEAPERGAGPAAVIEVAAAAAGLLDRPAEELAALTYANGLRFIGELK